MGKPTGFKEYPRRTVPYRDAKLRINDYYEIFSEPVEESLRKQGARREGRIGVRCVFSRESVAAPAGDAACDVDGSLNCHGYGSSVMVTATFGLVAAGEILRQHIAHA